MKLEKISIDIEKIGNISIFSHNGYILGFTDNEFLDDVSFFPIVINSKHDNKKDLEVYFNFISVMSAYNGYSDPLNYNIYLKEYNKGYDNRDEYDILKLIELASKGDVCITTEHDSNLINIVESLMNVFSKKDDRFVINSIEDDNVTTKILSLDDDNYVQIGINRLEQHFMSYYSTSDEIDDIVKIFEHIFEMLDKNLRKEK